jgi:opacity protein-like surface antigen
MFLFLLLALPVLTSAQGLEISGGYVHVTGDGGVDGFNVGAAAWFSRRVSIAFDYDSAWDTSRIGVFELTQTGLIVSKSHLQNFLVGPRITFPGLLTNKKNVARLLPFTEIQIGLSHLNSKLEDPGNDVAQEASDNAFSWMVGGGADYRLSPQWVGRLKVDLLRTHFAEQGQSKFRLGLGVAYTFGAR